MRRASPWRPVPRSPGHGRRARKTGGFKEGVGLAAACRRIGQTRVHFSDRQRAGTTWVLLVDTVTSGPPLKFAVDPSIVRYVEVT